VSGKAGELATFRQGSRPSANFTNCLRQGIAFRRGSRSKTNLLGRDGAKAPGKVGGGRLFGGDDEAVDHCV
jgi:hypothetical protein